MAEKPSTVDAYLAGFTGTHLSKLMELRAALRAAVPDADEKISYGMLAIGIKKNVIYYAAWEKHVALYGWLGADDTVLEPLASYISSKGTLKFPIDVALPIVDIQNLAIHLAERCR
jgi:uncharacterized protein YdhG (YjbR/CyaY superfamily)